MRMKDPKNQNVTAIWLSKEQRQRIDRAAKGMGLSRSAFMKACAEIVLADGSRKHARQN